MITMRKLRTYWYLLTQNRLLHDDCMCKHKWKGTHWERASEWASNWVCVCVLGTKTRWTSQCYLQAARCHRYHGFTKRIFYHELPKIQSNDIWPHSLATSNAHKVHNYRVHFIRMRMSKAQNGPDFSLPLHLYVVCLCVFEHWNWKTWQLYWCFHRKCRKVIA